MVYTRIKILIKKTVIIFLYTWVRASWIEFNICPTRCDLFDWFIVPIQQWERMAVDPVNQYQKLQLQLYQLVMMGVNTRNM